MTLADATPGYTTKQYADAVLQQWGVPVTPTNENTFERWASAESGGYNPDSAGGKFNLLNIVRTPGDGATGQGGSQGDIADFPDFGTGTRATANFFNVSSSPLKQAILNGFRNQDPAATNAAINAFYKTWGGSFAPGGTPSETVAGGAGSSSSATTTAATGGDCTNLITFPGSIPNFTTCNGRAVLGAAALAGGVVLMILGITLMSGTASKFAGTVPLVGALA